MNTIKIVLYLSLIIFLANGCSDFLITPGASVDSSAIIAYNADSGALYGELYFHPRAHHPKGSMRKIYCWDTGAYLGEIPEAEHTYNVVGNVNEHQLIIGETTFGGLP
mmetsp:Transcript_72811/g.109851  ORF Transcript_72811/g.109851 Transcript_72811/m.109851 type:complete len:108 (+) Transcript_72811:77-400(+)